MRRAGLAWWLSLGLLFGACDGDGGDGDAGTDAGPVAEEDAGPPPEPRVCELPVRPVTDRDLSVLLFTRTEDFRHASIPTAVEALEARADEGFAFTHTEDPAIFTDEDLADFDVVVFLHTTGDVLDDEHQAAFERWVRAGGGYVGVHAAADTEYDWPWYGRLVGAYFRNHPVLPLEATVTTEDLCHASTDHLEDTFEFEDEWYNFDRNPRRDHHVLMTVDEDDFTLPNTDGGPNMGGDHPIAWLKEFEGGRSFYTSLGHRPETWSNPLFMEHLLDGLRWAASPREWSWQAITTELRNPLAVDVAPDGRVFVIERTGELYVWSPETGRLTLALDLEVSLDGENGLLGIALSPGFASDGHVFLYYASPDETRPDEPPGWNILSRFTMTGDGTLDPSSEMELLRVPSERDCCHEGGALDFGPDGTLYLSTGDNTFPHDAGGFAPLDGREGREIYDARRTAPNPDDLRGKILRLRPDGTIPDGNLFDPSGDEGRPEIFVMGTRNPFRIAVDEETGRLFWGDVGPDAPLDTRRGPRGYDEINLAEAPGNYGWPYCIADNQPYREFDFETESYGELYDCTGMVPALLYYDYFETTYLALGDGKDPEGATHPALGSLDLVGRTAIAGDFYRVPEGDAPYALPEGFRDTLLMGEWTRNRLVSVEIEDDGRLGAVRRMVPFVPTVRPIDVATAPDGAIYVVEYGSSFFGDNEDAQLLRIEFSPDGTLPPVARIEASPVAGAAPLEVELSAEGSWAPGEGDAIASYEWDVDGDGTVDGTGATLSHTFTEGGVFQPTLVVVGTSGRRSLPVSRRIVVGNTPPEVTITTPADGSRVVDGAEVPLEATVTDAEDGTPPCEDWTWDIRLGHNSHTHPFRVLDGCTTSFEARLPSGADIEQHFFAIEARYRDRGGPSGEPALTARDGVVLGVDPAE
ncbi:MAG TPA: ThuA domain-containing protein [Sandaracinaceae bacterium LLY-WYZ-13_1]|nr:ThuA domain-containing protein [Sandaracinaceae bacterium LLY-WYZ-13_1]